jgi:hypothetical protein
MFTVTHHALERGKKRVGLDVKAFQKLSLKAWEKGYSQKDFKPGKMQDYFYDLFQYNHTAGGLRLHGEHCYVFTAQGVLITVIHIPLSHRKYKSYLKKESCN